MRFGSGRNKSAYFFPHYLMQQGGRRRGRPVPSVIPCTGSGVRCVVQLRHEADRSGGLGAAVAGCRRGGGCLWSGTGPDRASRAAHGLSPGCSTHGCNTARAGCRATLLAAAGSASADCGQTGQFLPARRLRIQPLRLPARTHLHRHARAGSRALALAGSHRLGSESRARHPGIRRNHNGALAAEEDRTPGPVR